jgi:putative hemolysin
LEDGITLKILFLFILLFLSGFFSGSEASLFSLTALHLHKMKEDKNPFYAYIHKLLAYPRRLLVTILVGNESVNITISVLTTSIFILFLGIEGKWIAIAVTTITLLIFGEAIPKTFAVNYPMRFATSVSVPLAFFASIERPVVWILEKVSDLFVYVLGRKFSQEKQVLTEDEFKTLVDVGHEEGALEEAEKDLIHRVFDLADTTVSDIMTPRVDMFCLPLTMGMEEMAKEILKTRYSRIPIYETDRDDILGILHARHLLEEITKGRRSESVKPLLKKPYFVPLERTAESMLRDFRMRRIQMALIVDEYGGIEGLVTLNDIMEDLVGDIYDEYDVKESLYNRVDDGSLIMSGAMDIEEFNNLMRTSVPVEDFDTLGGFVLHLFGKVPTRGEEIYYENYTFKVEKVVKRRIMTVRVKQKEDEHG